MQMFVGKKCVYGVSRQTMTKHLKRPLTGKIWIGFELYFYASLFLFMKRFFDWSCKKMGKKLFFISPFLFQNSFDSQSFTCIGVSIGTHTWSISTTLKVFFSSWSIFQWNFFARSCNILFTQSLTTVRGIIKVAATKVKQSKNKQHCS